MEESWRGVDHTQTSWGAADRCRESMTVIRTARMKGRKGEAGMKQEKIRRDRLGRDKTEVWDKRRRNND